MNSSSLQGMYLGNCHPCVAFPCPITNEASYAPKIKAPSGGRSEQIQTVRSTMSTDTSSNTAQSIILRSPDDWEKWNDQFQTRADSSKLWVYINPENENHLPLVPRSAILHPPSYNLSWMTLRRCWFTGAAPQLARPPAQTPTRSRAGRPS